MSATMKKLIIAPLVLAVGIILPILGGAYSGGPPDAHTGAPGESDCRSCHGTAVGDGSVAINGVPAEYSPGGNYTLTVTIQDPAQKRWGFELTAVDQAGNGAGSFTITDPTITQVTDNVAPGRDYMKQTTSGTFNNTFDGPINWSFDWTAPAAPAGTITFYAAGNAANGNLVTTGDFIYLTSAMAAVASCCNMAGDVNNNGLVNIQDVSYLVNFLYKSGPTPPCPEEGDTNGNGPTNIQDITYLINFLYKGGPVPQCL